MELAWDMMTFTNVKVQTESCDNKEYGPRKALASVNVSPKDAKKL